MDVSVSELWEMVMDRETWHAAIHGVAKSRTRLSDRTELNWTNDTPIKMAKIKESDNIRAGKEVKQLGTLMHC